MAPRRADVDREIARARSARRMLPWTLATAAGGAAMALAAGGGRRAAGALLAMGLLFSVFLWAVSVARCPACGAPFALGRRRPSSKGSSPARSVRSCPRCAAPFD